jgi:hypothetical protein
MPLSSKWASCSLNGLWKNSCSIRICWNPLVGILQLGQDLPTKEAQIRREKTKEDLRPFLTILGTSQRACLRVSRRGGVKNGFIIDTILD